MEKTETKAPEHRRKKVVVPGELVTDARKRLGQGVFVESGKVYSDSLGIAYPDSDTASVVPFSGRYIPKRGDLVVGIVSRQTVRGYLVDINSIYESYFGEDEVREALKRGSIVSAKVSEVNEVNEASLFDVRVFYGGEIIRVSPAKVPRIVGKNGSMLSVLKEGTGCNLLVGRNGWVWVKGGDERKLADAISLIESESHLSNLTVKVQDFLKGKKVK